MKTTLLFLDFFFCLKKKKLVKSVKQKTSSLVLLMHIYYPETLPLSTRIHFPLYSKMSLLTAGETDVLSYGVILYAYVV